MERLHTRMHHVFQRVLLSGMVGGVETGPDYPLEMHTSSENW